MSNIIKINNTDLGIKEYQGQRVVTFKDIDAVHERVEGTAGRNFRENKDKLILGTDYFEVCADEIRRNKIMSISAKTHQDMVLITESGYLMLVKSMQDDLAWKVQRQLVNSYFKVKESTTTSQPDTPLQQQLAEAKLRNARARQASIWLKLAEVSGVPIHKQICASYASGVLNGTEKNILPLPEVEKTYSATEIGNILGISANMVGRIAKANHLKTDEYGITVMDVTRGRNKDVENFRYYEKAIDKFKELIS